MAFPVVKARFRVVGSQSLLPLLGDSVMLEILIPNGTSHQSCLEGKPSSLRSTGNRYNDETEIKRELEARDQFEK